MWLSGRLGYSVRHILNVPAIHSLARSNICSFTSSIISPLNHWPSHLYTHLFIPPCALTKGYHATGQASWERDRCLMRGHVTSEADTYSPTCAGAFLQKYTRTVLVLSPQTENKSPRCLRLSLSVEVGRKIPHFAYFYIVTLIFQQFD